MPAGCLQVGHVVRAVAGPCSHLVRGEDVGPPLKQQLRSAHVAARARLDQGSTPVLPRHRARRGGGSWHRALLGSVTVWRPGASPGRLEGT